MLSLLFIWYMTEGYEPKCSSLVLLRHCSIWLRFDCCVVFWGWPNTLTVGCRNVETREKQETPKNLGIACLALAKSSFIGIARDTYKSLKAGVPHQTTGSQHGISFSLAVWAQTRVNLVRTWQSNKYRGLRTARRLLVKKPEQLHPICVSDDTPGAGLSSYPT